MALKFKGVDFIDFDTLLSDDERVQVYFCRTLIRELDTKEGWMGHPIVHLPLKPLAWATRRPKEGREPGASGFGEFRGCVDSFEKPGQCWQSIPLHRGGSGGCGGSVPKEKETHWMLVCPSTVAVTFVAR